MGLGSEIRDPEKTYSGSRIQGQKGTGSRIRIRKTAYAVLCRTISWAGCGTATRLSRQRTGISGCSSGSARAETSGEVPQVGPNFGETYMRRLRRISSSNIWRYPAVLKSCCLREWWLFSAFGNVFAFRRLRFLKIHNIGCVFRC